MRLYPSRRRLWTKSVRADRVVYGYRKRRRAGVNTGKIVLERARYDFVFATVLEIATLLLARKIDRARIQVCEALTYKFDQS